MKYHLNLNISQNDFSCNCLMKFQCELQSNNARCYYFDIGGDLQYIIPDKRMTRLDLYYLGRRITFFEQNHIITCLNQKC